MGSADLNATFYGPVKKVNIDSLNIFKLSNLKLVYRTDLWFLLTCVEYFSFPYLFEIFKRGIFGFDLFTSVPSVAK